LTGLTDATASIGATGSACSFLGNLMMFDIA
jgi:hypothetical protein